jgi:hypothetical protein
MLPAVVVAKNKDVTLLFNTLSLVQTYKNSTPYQSDSARPTDKSNYYAQNPLRSILKFCCIALNGC